jgi:RNA polymerase sigma-70 factor (ECF subfamily)
VKDGILTLPGPAFQTWAPAIGAREESSGRDGWTRTGVRLSDKDAFWELLAPCRDKLFNYIRKSLRFATAAEDVYQETVLNAFRYFGTYRPEREFAPWIFAIAHNALRDHFRREARTPAGPAVERLGEEDDERKREMVREVFAYAEKLKPRHREVFFLFYDSGFSVAEIAGVTGLREGNVKLILHQARNSLKAALGVTHD